MTPAPKRIQKVLGSLEPLITLPDRRRPLERMRRDFERRRQVAEQHALLTIVKV